jgi:nicotinate-nucleotide pyrophosphorylase (carboxylating)
MSSNYTQHDWSETLEDDCTQLVRLAVREDLDRWQDWTTVAMVTADQTAQASIVSRCSGVFCGSRVAQVVADVMQLDVKLESHRDDGSTMEPTDLLVTLSGNARDILTAERTILNFLGRLCGIATLAAQYVQAVADTNTEIYDTRKTTPGWRRLEKFAVRCGGATNHRTGLYDAILIKDNHLAFAGIVDAPEQAIERVRKFLATPGLPIPDPNLPLTIEVDSLEQLASVLPLRPNVVLLDNMEITQLQTASRLRTEQAPDVVLEASGGITLDTIRAVAETGVDRISVGALTHSATSLDLGLDWLRT